MKAAERTFQELLNGNVQYRVPLFQRVYSWTEEQWQRLWDDLLYVYSLPAPHPHFLGAIVTLPMALPAEGAVHMLVDGQQRFITLLVLLSVIRDAAQGQSSGELANQISDECLINKYARDPAQRVKLLPTQLDQEAFRAVVWGQGTQAEGQLGLAQVFFRARLSAGDRDKHPIELSELKRRISECISLVSIQLDQDDNPQRIFESLNHTGMSLSGADLVRNFIFMDIPSEIEQMKAYDLFWKPMEELLQTKDGSKLTDFLWRYLMKQGLLVKSDQVYEGITKVRADERSRQISMVQFLQELHRYAHYYARFWNPAREAIPALRESFERLNQWEVEVAYPFLLTLLDRLQCGVISEDDALRVLRGIESFVVRRYICDVPSNQLRTIFAQMAHDAPEREFVKYCSTFLQNHKWPDDADFHADFQTATVYVRNRLSRTRFILTALERSYPNREKVEMNSGISIEHVMPQTLSQDWLQELGTRAYETQAQYLHTVGNLTYSAYNADMGNERFAKKRGILKKSNFELNKSITRATKWGEAEIQRRGKEMADRAVTIWKRPM